jgi:hypothetical protein
MERDGGGGSVSEAGQAAKPAGSGEEGGTWGDGDDVMLMLMVIGHGSSVRHEATAASTSQRMGPKGWVPKEGRGVPCGRGVGKPRQTRGRQKGSGERDGVVRWDRGGVKWFTTRQSTHHSPVPFTLHPPV